MVIETNATNFAAVLSVKEAAFTGPLFGRTEYRTAQHRSPRLGMIGLFATYRLWAASMRSYKSSPEPNR